MKSQVYQLSIQVREEDLDELNHVNNLTYLRWCLKAAVAHSAAVGWPAERYRTSGFGFVVRSHQIKYRGAARAGDQLELKTWIAGMKKTSSLRKYEIVYSGSDQKLVEAETNWAFVNLNTLELTPIATDIREAFFPET